MYTSEDLIKLSSDKLVNLPINKLTEMILITRKELEDIKSGKASLGSENRIEILDNFIKKAEKVLSTRGHTIAKNQVKQNKEITLDMQGKIDDYTGIVIDSLEILINSINKNSSTIKKDKDSFLHDLRDPDARLMEVQEAKEFRDVLLDTLLDIKIIHNKQKSELKKLIKEFFTSFENKK